MIRVNLWIVVITVLLCSTAYAIDPPKSLNWDISYDSVTSIIHKNDGMKLKKYSNGDPKIAKLGRGYHEYPVLTIPEGFLRTEVTDVKILDKKAQRTFLIFDSTDQFKAFQYILKWDNDEKNKGMRKSWVFHSRLYDILKNKYGEPTSDEISPTTKAKEIPSGTPYSTYWEDDDGSSVTLLITRQTHDAVIATIDAYLVFVVYKQEDYGVNTKWEVDSEDDL